MRKPRRRVTLTQLALAAFLAVPLQAAGQTVVTGVVTTQDDGVPVPNATVSIPSLKLTATTDASGRYSITVPADQATRGRSRATHRSGSTAVSCTPS